VRPHAPEAESLPEEFTAVRFYFRDSFPDTPAHRELVRDLVERLATRRPVVLLNTGVVVDDHLDAEPPEGPRVLRPLAGVAPERNLEAQSAVVARSSLFVGTYGGLAHLAPVSGVPTIGLAADPTTINPVHLALARRTAAAYGTSLAVVDGPGFELLDALAGRRAAAAA
jgi:ADP-heptose:LPS heptosyltransferase